MARAGFQMLGLLLLGQAGEKPQRRHALPGRRDVVIRALDRLHRDAGDLADIDALALDLEAVLRDFQPLEDPLHRGQIEFRGHVHHRQIFIVEDVVMVVFRAFALRLHHDLVGERLGVLFHVHRDERGQLHQPRIDQPPGALVFEADALDHHMLELPHGDAAAEIGHLGRGGIRVDRPADQRQRARLRLGVFLGQIGGRGQRQRRGLADRDHVDVRPQRAHELDQVERVILDVELARADRNVTRIVPIRHVNVGIGQKTGDGGAQERRIMARHRRHQQDAPRHRCPALDLEMDERAEGLVDQRLDLDQMVPAIGGGDRADAPVGLDHHAREAALGHPAPGGHQLEHRMRRQPPDRIGGHGTGRSPHPFIGVPDGFHQVVVHHALHRHSSGNRTIVACSVASGRYVSR